MSRIDLNKEFHAQAECNVRIINGVLRCPQCGARLGFHSKWDEYNKVSCINCGTFSIPADTPATL